MSPYEVMFQRKPRWVDRVPAHIRHMTEVEDEGNENDADNVQDDDENEKDDVPSGGDPTRVPQGDLNTLFIEDNDIIVLTSWLGRNTSNRVYRVVLSLHPLIWLRYTAGAISVV